MVVAVVVVYRPDTAALQLLLQRLAMQTQQIVVVDNTDSPADPEGAPDVDRQCGVPLVTLRLHANTGVGHAQNLGIARARQAQATHVLLMDQDSMPPANMVPALLRVLDQSAAFNAVVAAVGPACRDVKTNAVHPLVSRAGWRIRRVAPEHLRAPLPVEYLPASGCLIPAPALAAVGFMRSEYFIDRIDVEWCLRARRLGYLVLAAPGVEMQHDLGQHELRLLGRRLYLGADWRAYFHVRNSLAMALRARIPLFWRLDQLFKLPAYTLLYVAAARHGRGRMVGRLLLAISHGLLDRMGPANQIPE